MTPTQTPARIVAIEPKSLTREHEDLNSHLVGWLASLRSDNTRHGYRVDVATFMRWCIERDLDLLAVKRSHLDLWARDLAASYAPSTVVRKLAAVSSLYEYLEDEQVIDKNPATKVRRPRISVEDQQTTPARTQDEARRLIAAATAPRDRALVLVLLLMGLRISEALTLDLGTFEQDRGHTTVMVSGKGGRRTRVAVPPPVIAAVEDVATAEGRETGPLFAREGVRWNRAQATRAIKRLGRAAGLQGDLRPHQLRATAITAALELGEPLHRVQTFARHSSPLTTRRYDANRQNLDGSPSYILATALTTD
jgi:integrase/recombinase XerD